MYLPWRGTEKHIRKARLLASDHSRVIYSNFVNKRQSGISSQRSQPVYKITESRALQKKECYFSPAARVVRRALLSLNLRQRRWHFLNHLPVSQVSEAHSGPKGLRRWRSPVSPPSFPFPLSCPRKGSFHSFSVNPAFFFEEWVMKPLRGLQRDLQDHCPMHGPKLSNSRQCLTPKWRMPLVVRELGRQFHPWVRSQKHILMSHSTAWGKAPGVWGDTKTPQEASPETQVKMATSIHQMLTVLLFCPRKMESLGYVG